jgi:hypothetical protein
MPIAICTVFLLAALVQASPLVAVSFSGAQAPVVAALPLPGEIEEALTAERRSRNPTFVEYQDLQAGRTLVVGVPYSRRGLNDDLTDDFENIYEVLVRRQWVQHFTELLLVVPQPLVRIRITIDDVRRLHANEITKAEFQEKWRTDKLGPS